MFEFDESQHFNQFRLATLEWYAQPSTNSFDVEQYRALSGARVVKPGTSRFHALGSFDPLFPPMYKEEKQDNRDRQRAFRDFLKDITLTLKNLNPTLRISYKTTNGKKTDFDSADVDAARRLIQSKD